MGLRCSLLGHDFDDREVEHERTERGSEVVVTITEFETCSQCGEQRVVSENTEVTTVDPPADDPSSGDDTAAETDSQTGGDPASMPTATDRDAQETESDDGIILEEEPPAESERGRGEWPATDAEANEDDDATGGPTNLDSSADDVEPDPDPEPEPEPELEPAPTDTTRPVETTDAGFARAGEATAPSESFEAGTSGPTELFCPNCDSGSLGDRHSLRPGDICPECRSGYVAERERS